MSKALTGALEKLRRNGRVAASALTKDQKTALADFARRTGCVQETVAGRGTIYRVLNEKALDTYWRQLRPRQEDELPDNLPQRAFNIATSRDSKSADPGHDTYYLLLKSTGTGVSWSNGHATLDLSASSNNYGAAALGITTDDDWTSEQALWLVENQKLFDRLDWLPPGTTASVAYYGGQLNNLLIEWLSRASRTKQVILFPDYDGVGLLNYARLKSKLGKKCSFWLMPGWKNLLKEFGNNRIWLDTFGDFKSANHRLQEIDNPELQQLMSEMQKQALALEQEAIWLSTRNQEGHNVQN
jgi:hypothetical protein